MSGPKIDFAELERQKQAELERQRLERLRLMAEYQQLQMELEVLLEKCSKAQTENAASGKELSNMKLSVAAHQLEVDAALQALQTATHTISRLLIKLRSATGMFGWPSENDNSSLRRLLQDVDQQLGQTQRKAQTEVREHIQDIQRLQQKQKQAQKLTDTMFGPAQTIALVPLTLSNPIAGECAMHLDIQTKRYETLKPFIQSAVDHSAYLFGRDKKDFYAALQNLRSAIAAQNAAQIELAIDWMAMNVQRLESLAAQNMALYANYRALWEQINTLKNQTAAPCPGPGSFVSHHAISVACAQLKEEAKRLDEAHYIRTQVEKVMEQFGYQTLTPVVLYDQQDLVRQDPTGKHYIALADDARRALHVRIGSNGQLMMQVATTSPSASRAILNGQPMLSKPKNAHSINAAMQEQRNFCRDHPLMLKALEAAGIKTRVACHNRVDEQFAICLHEASQPAVTSARQAATQRAHLQERALDE